jgi:hypothetical protein
LSEQPVATHNDTPVPSTPDNNPTPVPTPASSSSSDNSIQKQGPGQISTLPSGETMPATGSTSFSAPWLNVIWPSVPDVLPVAPGNASGSGGGAPGVGTITVDFASVRAAEQSFLSELSTMVSQYDALAGATQAAIADPGFFGQQAQAVIYWQENNTPQGSYNWNHWGPASPGSGPTTSGTYIVPDARIQFAAREFAYGTNGTNGMVNAMEVTLEAIASSAETAGQILAAVAKAMDAYAYADVHSAAPPLSGLGSSQQG